VLALVVLLSTAIVPTVEAAPLPQYAGWAVFEQPSWDLGGRWYSRQVVIRPTVRVAERYPVTMLSSVPVTLIAPTGVVQTFAEPRFVTTFQEVVLPELVDVVPVEILGNGIQVIQVEPNLYAFVAPQLYCPYGAFGPCELTAAQLAARRAGFTTVALNGPLGPGMYVAFRAA
jgi:hypothetical protein